MTVARAADRELTLFLGLTFLFSAPFYLYLARGGAAAAAVGSPLLHQSLMWCPGVAALVARRVSRGSLRGLGWGWGRSRYQVAAYLLPLALCLAVYPPVWALGGGGLDGERLQAFAGRFGLAGLPVAAVMALTFLAGPLLLMGNAFGALGEEIGWRGLLVPRLAERWGFARSSLASGLIWAVWHWPLILILGREWIPDYSPPWALACFTVAVNGMSFAFAWLRLRSGSLWTAVILHAGVNTWIQGFFDPLTVDAGGTFRMVGEYGALTAAAAVALGAGFWALRSRLPAPAAAP